MVEGYYPNTLDEALEILENTDVIIYSGGTDLMVRNKNATSLLPKFNKDLMYIDNLKELKKFKNSGSAIEIGSACTLSSILREDNVPEILKESIRQIASPAIRNMATLGGNICNASPAGDTLPILYALNAKVKLTKKNFSRQIGIKEFILGPRKIFLEKNEILESIIIEKKFFNKMYYEKVAARKASAISKLSFVGLAEIEENIVKDIRIAIGAVAPTIVRIQEAENIIIGSRVQDIEEKIDHIKSIYSEKINPINDQRSTASYRKTVSIRLIQNFFKNKL